MRIIDKNHDFYDYLQHIYRDDSKTFDRRDSFVLTKDIFRDFLRWDHFKLNSHFFIKLQVCHTIWLFLVTAIEVDEFEHLKDYSVRLITSWKNYSIPRKLISIDLVSFDYVTLYKMCSFRDLDEELVIKNANVLCQAIDQNNYSVLKSFNEYTVYRDDNSKITRHIPILAACGLAECIDPLDVYLSIEEYFSLEQQDGERTESVGLTNKEKIENHGFDTKSSFRGN